jgi:hypothetical protein
MNAYFEKLKYFMILMALMFVFSLPSMSIYASYDGLAAKPMAFITRYSLGNMGKK